VRMDEKAMIISSPSLDSWRHSQSIDDLGRWRNIRAFPI
jgi:hypothetical protein